MFKNRNKHEVLLSEKKRLNIKSKRYRFFSILLTCVVACTNVLAFKVGIHKDMTKEVLTAGSDGQEFSVKAAASVADANVWTDLLEPNLVETHADDNHLGSASVRLQIKREQIRDALLNCRSAEARELLGQALHTVQDIYSHSNSINNGHPIPDVLGLQNGTAACDADNDFAPSGLVSGYFNLDAYMLHYLGYLEAPPTTFNIEPVPPSNSLLDLNECTLLPEGNCCHRELNKDEDIDPDNVDLYDVAREAAELATRDYLDSLYQFFIETSSEENAAYMMGQLRRHNKDQVFVIDDSGSMVEEIGGIKDAANAYLSNMIEIDETPRLGLVTFKELVRSRVVGSCNVSQFRDEVQNLRATVGGELNPDCPESMNAAMMVAIKQFPPQGGFWDEVDWSGRLGGRIFLASDASANDWQDGERVADLAKIHKIGIDAILTDDCGQINDNHFGSNNSLLKRDKSKNTNQNKSHVNQLTQHLVRPYLRELTTFTGGTLFEVEKTETQAAASIMMALNNSRGGVIAERSWGNGETLPTNIEIPIDDTFEDSVTFLFNANHASGLPVDISLMRPNGDLVEDTDTDVVHTRLSTIDSFTVTTPAPGDWKISLSGGRLVTFRAFGVSGLETTGASFFSTENRTLSRHDEELLPVNGTPTINSSVIVSTDVTLNIIEPHIIIRGSDGSVLSDLIPSVSGTTLSAPLIIPRENYLFEVSGKTQAGHDFIRQTPMTIGVSKVSISTDFPIYFIQPGEIRKIRLKIHNKGGRLDYQIKRNQTSNTTGGVISPDLIIDFPPASTQTFDFDAKMSDRAEEGDSFTVTFIVQDTDDIYNRNTVSVRLIAKTDPELNKAPLALPAYPITEENLSVPITLEGFDFEYDDLTFNLLDQPQHGVITGEPPQISYFPEENYNGIDFFTFNVNDGLNDAETPAQVIIKVLSVNNPPISNDVLYEMNEDTVSEFTLTAEDVDSDELTFELLSQPQHGVLSGVIPQIIYTPNENFFGLDTFTFIVSDGELDSGIKTVTFDVAPVNDQPVSVDQFLTTLVGEEIEFTIQATDVDSDALTFNLLYSPQNGVLTSTESLLIYTPNLGFSGIDSFEFEVNDGELNSDLASVEISVLEPDIPGRAAFSVLSPEHSLLDFDNNVALLALGAEVIEVSSGDGSRALDNVVNSFWNTDFDNETDQSIVIQLAGINAPKINLLRLLLPYSSKSPKNFTLALSNTNAEADSFIDVLHGIAELSRKVQEFELPNATIARFAKLTIHDNHGEDEISTASIELIDSSRSGVVSDGLTFTNSATSYRSYINRPENLLDNDPQTQWATEVREVGGGFIVFKLKNNSLFDRVRMNIDNDPFSLREFEIYIAGKDGEFEQILAAEMQATDSIQEFVFPEPVNADLIKLVAVSRFEEVIFNHHVTLNDFYIPSLGSSNHIASITDASINNALFISVSDINSGAAVIHSSDKDLAINPAKGMLDNNTKTFWETDSLEGHYVLIQLAGGNSHQITGIEMVTPESDKAVKNFEVWVSDSDLNNGSFTRHLAATSEADEEQLFIFNGGPVSGKFIKFVPLDNYGNLQNIVISEFKVITDKASSVHSYSSRKNVDHRAENVLNSSSSTTWQTAQGLVTDQWLKLQISDGEPKKIQSIKIQSEIGVGPQNYEIRVSTTNANDSSFSTILTGSLLNQSGVQEIELPTFSEAVFIQFVWINGYAQQFISVSEIKVNVVSNAANITNIAREVKTSSYSNELHQPTNVLTINQDRNDYWQSAPDQISDQWISFALAGERDLLIDQLMLVPHGNSGDINTIKDFELQVSLTTDQDNQFNTVFSGRLLNNGTSQHFWFPAVEARYVRLLAKNNYGGDHIQLSRLWLISPERGNNEVLFQNTSTNYDFNTAEYSWAFGDATQSSERDPLQNYSDSGIYPVSMQIADASGENGDFSLNYEVIDGLDADFVIYPLIYAEGEKLSFIDLTNYIQNNNADFREWSWSDGSDTDFTYSSVQTHSYSDNGEYTVKMSIGSQSGLVDSSVITIQVINLPPVLDLGEDRDFIEGDISYFNPEFTDPGSTDIATLQCHWQFGDGTEDMTGLCSTIANVGHIYTNEGDNHTATLTITDKDGASTSDTLNIHVVKRPTSLEVCGPIIGIDNSDVEVEITATLLSSDGELLEGLEVDLVIAGENHTVITDQYGVAHFWVQTTPGVALQISGEFSGTDVYDSATGTSSVLTEITLNSVQADMAGTEHWTGFQNNFEGQDYLTLYITGDTETQGRVSIPGMGYCVDFSVTPGTISTIEIPDNAEIITKDGVEAKSIHVTSLNEVVVYGLNYKEHTTDAFLSFPVDTLGLEYLVQDYRGVISQTGAQFGIVATENDTHISITPSIGYQGHPSNQEFTVVLDRGEAYQGQNSDSPALAGTRIISDKPIAVFGGHRCAFVPVGVGACDHLVEQLPPLSAWGTHYLAASLATRKRGDTYQILAANDDTQVLLNGELLASLSAGENFEQIIEGFVEFTANQPILVTQYSNGRLWDNVIDSDPFMVVIPAIEQYASTYTVTTPAEGYKFNFINIIAPSESLALLQIDGGFIDTSLFQPIGVSNYMGAQIPVSIGSHHLNGSEPFGIIVYGYDEWDSYGYIGGLAIPPTFEAGELILSSESEIVVLGNESCVTATLTDINGLLISGVLVDFNVTGVNTLNGYSHTNAQGESFFCYTGEVEGIDTIKASISSLSSIVAKEWIAGDGHPIAIDSSYTTGKNEALAVLLQASDSDGDILSYVIVDQPQHGVLSGTAPVLTYTPNLDFIGDDSFTFEASDAEYTSNQATVEITVNTLPARIGAAFSVPAPEYSLLQWNNNVALNSLGAQVLETTSGNGSRAITNTPFSYWNTSSGQITDQSIVIKLAGESSALVDRIRLIVAGNDTSPHHFTLALSATTAEPNAFSDVLQGAIEMNQEVQEFDLPQVVYAKFARLTFHDNHGSSSKISIRTIEIIDSSRRGIAAYDQALYPSVSSYSDMSNRPENLLNGKSNSRWKTASGLVEGEFVIFKLDQNALFDRINMLATHSSSGIKDFEIHIKDSNNEFQPIYSGQIAEGRDLQEFIVSDTPIHTTEIKLLVISNQGGSSQASLDIFDVPSIDSFDHLVSLVAQQNGTLSIGSPEHINNGATIVEFSSSRSSSYKPEYMLDSIPLSQWQTETPTNEYVTIGLAGSQSHLIQGIELLSSGDEQNLQFFELWISETNTAAESFVQVLSATAIQTTQEQVFMFPEGSVSARFIKLVVLNNYGHQERISLNEIKVLSTQQVAGVVSSSRYNINSRAENTINGHASSSWRSADDQSTNQWIKYKLTGDEILQLNSLWIKPTSQVPKNFEVRVSTTSDDDDAFTTVMSRTMRNSSSRQKFVLPANTHAKYLQLFFIDGYTTEIGINNVYVFGSSVSTTSAQLIDTSSFEDAGTTPLNTLSIGSSDSFWQTARNDVENQSMTFSLRGQRNLLIDQLLLAPPEGSASVRDFELQVSTTTENDDQFSTVLSDTLLNNGQLQSFRFEAMPARFVRFVALNNYGATNIRLNRLWINSPEIGQAAVQFHDISTEIDPLNSSYQWDFGDGETSVLRDPYHVFPEPAIYPVSLQVVDQNGQASQYSVDYQVVDGFDVEFDVQTAPFDEGKSLTFTDTSPYPEGDSAVMYEWQWGDGSDNTFNQSVATHMYRDNGSYIVKLLVMSQSGIISSRSQIIEVNNLPPVVDMGDDITMPIGYQWQNRPIITDPGSDDRIGRECRWQFGDGSPDDISSCNSTTHTYNQTGQYTATLTVIDKDGASTTDTLIVTVNKRQANLAVCGPTMGINANSAEIEVTATLYYPSQSIEERINLITLQDETDIQGHSIGFIFGNQTFSALTNQYGVASFRTTAFANQSLQVQGQYLGNELYAGSTASSSVELKHHDQPFVKDSKGVEFQTAFIEHDSGVGEQSILYITGDTDTSGRISIPGLGYCQDFTVNAGEINEIILPSDETPFITRLVKNTIDGKEGKAIHVTSLDEITVYSMSYEAGNSVGGTFNTSEGHLNYPVDTLGQEYIVQSYYNSRVPAKSSQFGVVASENNTLVTITPSIIYGSNPIKQPSIPFSITLNRGEVYQARQTSHNSPPGVELIPSFSGTLISADKPMTVMAGNEKQAVPVLLSSRSGFLNEQMLPISTWGTHFYTVPFANRAGDDIIRIMAAEDNTEVIVNGEVVAELSVAQFHEIVLSEAAEIITSKAAMVHQYGTGFIDPQHAENRPFMVTVPPYQQHQNQVLTVAPNNNFEDNYINITLAAEGLNSLLLDGVVVDNSLFSDISSSGFIGARIPVEIGSHTFSADVPLGVISYGYGFHQDAYDSYGYSASTYMSPINIDNLAPVAQGATFNLDENSQLSFNLNATDVNGDVLTYNLVNQPENGALTGDFPDLVYTPNESFSGIDQLSFFVNDGELNSNTAIVFFVINTVNELPVALDTLLSVDENQNVSAILQATDSDGDTLSYLVVDQPQHGVLTGTVPDLVYTPDVDYVGNDSFTFTVSDAQGSSNIATVSIIVNLVNTAPIALDQTITPLLGDSVSITLQATDDDNDDLTYSIVNAPQNGVLSGDAPNLVYTVDTGYSGVDSFTFIANDGTDDSNIAIVSLQISPTVNAQDVSVLESDTQASVVLSLTTPALVDATINWETIDGTAIADEDYISTTGTSTILAGESETTVFIDIIHDELYEETENLQLQILSVENLRLGIDTATVTISDDQLCLTDNLIVNPGAESELIDGEIPGWNEIEGNQWARWLAPPTPLEGGAMFDAGAANEDGFAELAQVVDLSVFNNQLISFSGALRTLDESPGDVARIVVEYLDSDTNVLESYDTGDISSPLDWTIVTDQRQIPAGAQSARIRLLANWLGGDDLDAWFDNLSLQVQAPVISINDVSVNEADGEITFDINLSCPIAKDVSFNYSTSDGDAIADEDYTHSDGSLTISSGDTNVTITVPVIDDEVVEEDESFNLTLTDLVSEQTIVINNNAIGTIFNDDEEQLGGCIIEPFGTAGGFNVFVLENLNQFNTDVEGRLAIGGNMIVQNYSVGVALQSNDFNGLVVGGNLDYNGGTVFHGDVVYAGNLNNGNVTVLNGQINQGQVIDFNTQAQVLNDLSNQLANTSVNAITDVKPWGAIELIGTDVESNVFILNASDLSVTNGLSINVPHESSVLINVTGQQAVMQFFGFNLNGLDTTKVLFNFVDAQTLTMRGIGIKGSILAPNTDVQFDNGQIDGAMMIKSLSGSGESHNQTYHGCLTQ